MDIVPPDDLPGAAFDFRNVRNVFEDAAADMHQEQMLFMDGFTLQDAMSAFEIGEPRLDSGYIPPGDNRPKFNPLAPLLPEELCWIIDRSFSYEMEWHNGNFMSHTILTFLYIHHLGSIDSDLVPTLFLTANDPDRPPEYITIVLRTAVAGLLKCCDLTWRELSKGAVQDTEDWQSDKCEVYLLEGTPVRVVTSMLEEASVWVSDSEKVPYQWKDPLISRLQLRKAFLQLLDTNVHRSPAQFKSYITICQEFVNKLRLQRLPELPQDSTARHAFDPYISRRLNTVVPIRVLPIGSAEETWKAFDIFFEGLKEVSRLAAVHSLSTWKAVGTLRAWTAKPPIQQPYIRSLTQSAFYDGLLVFDRHPFVWIVDKFFYETIGISWSFFRSQVSRRWVGSSVPPFDILERDIYKLIIPHIKGNWSNPPRRRRHLMKSLVGWHRLYDTLTEVTLYVDVSDLPRGNILSVIPNVVLLWRLSSIREIVFSGFQLELYAPEERTFAYWYLTQVFEAELACYEALLPIVATDTPAHREMVYNQQMATALQSLCTSLFIMTVPLLSFNWNRTRPNFFRRYKWAFKPDYEKFESEPVMHPDLAGFMQACLKVLKGVQGDNVAPREGIELAVGLLRELGGIGLGDEDGDSNVDVRGPRLGAWADRWVDERKEFTQRLVDIAEGLFATFSPPSSRRSPPPNSALTSSPLPLPLPLPPPPPPPPSLALSFPSSTTSSTSKSMSMFSSGDETTTSATSLITTEHERESEAELKMGLDSTVSAGGIGGGTGVARLGEVKLRWDPNVHPWFPIPKVDYQMEGD